MSDKWAFPLVLVAILLVILLPATSLGQQSPGGAEIEPTLLDVLSQEDATADLFVFMEAQADLGPAAAIEDWQARGRYVYDTLRQVATQSQAPVIAYAQEHGLAYHSFFSNNAIYLQGGDLDAVQDLARLPGVALLRLPEVARILPDSEPATEPQPSEPLDYGWNLDTLDPNGGLYGMQAAQVWQQYGITGEGIVVANIDTGVYYQHVSLDRQYRGNTTGIIGGPYDHDYNWYQPNFMPCGNGTFPCDADSHGTATIGIMVAETPNLSHQLGVAPSARWIACQGCDDPPYCTEVALSGCADWMLAPCPIGVDPGDPSCDPALRPHIINNSWGGSGCNTWYQPYVQAWVASGIFPAFAAGNAGGCGTVASPGDLPESFGTAAHFTDGQNAYAGGPSCFFPTPTCDPAAHDIDPHVNAPTGGLAPINEQSQYFALSGTSGACPHAAGTVALIWSASPGLIGQIDATFTILEQSANREVPSPVCGKPACAGANDYPNYDLGWGYLDALAAVEMAGVGGLGALQGTVTEAAPLNAPGDPLPGVTITARRVDTLYSFEGETGPIGYYTLTLPVGTYTITADGPQHGPDTVTGVTIATDTVTTLDFQLLPKGLLFGYITDAESGAPLAARVSAPGAGFVDTDPDTGYYTFYLGQGSHDVVAQANNYASQTVTVDIVSGQQIQQDFALIASLALAPWPIHASVELSGTLDLTTVITNRTAAAYDYHLSYDAARAGDEGTILLVHGEILDENPDAFAIALTNLGYEYAMVDAADFYSSTIPELLEYAAIIYTGNPSAGAEQDHIIAYLDAGGRLLLSDFGFTFDHHTSRLHEVYFQALSDGDWEWAGVLNGLDIMAGLYPDISSSIAVYYSSAAPEGVGIFELPGSDFTGIRTARAGYRAVFLSFDLNRIGAREPGDADETPVVYRAMLWLLGYPVEVPWYSAVPSSGTIPPNASASFTSRFTATPAVGIEQPGDFYAELHVEPSAMGEIYPRLDVPVHLEVLPTPTMGRLVGTVTSDRPGGPLPAEVTMKAAGGSSLTTTTDWFTGDYGYWLEQGTYTVTISADGYLSATAQVAIAAGLTTTHDVELVRLAPQISVSPLSIEEALPFGQTATQTIFVANEGIIPLEFAWREQDLGMIPLDPAITGVGGAQILYHVSHGGHPEYYEELVADLEGLGATVDIVSTDPISAALLSNYDVLWIGDNLETPFGYAEVDAIEAWLNDGGGLFVNYECCDDTTAPVLTAMFDIHYTGPGGYDGVTTNIYPHLTTLGVSDIYLPSPHQAITVTGSAEIVVYDVGGDPAAALNEVGSGKIFVLPDDAFFDSVYGQAGNTTFGRNVFGWLFGDVDWLAQDPVTATVPPGEAVPVTVTLDAGDVDEPGIYLAYLIAGSNDPFTPSVALPVTLTVTPTAGLGKLAGTVTSDRPGGPLRAGVHVEDSGGSVWTLYTSPDTGEYGRWLAAGPYTVTASAAGYITDSTTVVVNAQDLTVLDFELALNAPGVAVIPPAVEQTLPWGLTATQQLSITNVGLLDLDFDLIEEDLGAEPAAGSAQAYAIDRDNDTLISFSLDAPDDPTVIASLTNEAYTGADFRLNDFSTLWAIHWSMAVLYTIDTTTGAETYHAFVGAPNLHTWTALAAAADGTLYGVTDYWLGIGDHESYLWTIDPDQGTPTQIGQITNAECVYALAINLDDEMYAFDVCQDVLIQVDPVTAAGTIVGSVGFDAFYSPGMDFDDDSGILYLAAHDAIANEVHLRTVDTTSGATTVIGTFPGTTIVDGLAIVSDGRVDIPWLSETPTGGTVLPGSAMPVDLTFDATGVSGPGVYWGNLHVESNDPLIADLPVPVTMTVIPGQDLGQIEGIVGGTGYCDGEWYPLAAEVLVEASDGMTWTATSDPGSGYYTQWVPTGTYTLTAYSAGHVTTTATVQVVGEQTTIHDFDLRWYEPCLTITPATFALTLSVNSRLTQTLALANDGARDLLWTLHETTDTLALPTLPPIPRFEGEVPRSTEPTSIEPLPAASQPVPNHASPPAYPLFGEPAYGLDTGPFDLVYIPDTTDPGTWTVLANVGRFFSGGDFWHGDFSKMYALDFYTNEFVTLDMSSGERTVIGVAHTLPGHHWTGLTVATDGTIYGVSAECNVASGLYTIDRLTGEATLVGTTSSAPCLIDVAINAQGEMYAVDISSDALFQIDPTSAAATAIGLLGFPANHAQALDFEEESGLLYWAAADEYNGSLRRIDTNTGSSTHIGYFPNYTGVDCFAFATGGGDPFWGDVPWVSEVPTNGVTLADEAFEVDVIFDTTVLTVGKCYTASLGLLHDDPQHADPALVPLTLCVDSAWPVFYLTKTVAAGDLLPGETTTYTLIFGNDGSLETGITISDVLPAEVEYGGSEPAGIYDPVAHEVVWNGLVLDAGARMTATIAVTLSTGLAPGTRLTNTAYLLWQDEVLSNWAGLRVGDRGFYIYLPVIVREYHDE